MSNPDTPSAAPDQAPPQATGAAAAALGVPELIWLRPERSPRGPQPAHSRAAIAAAAIALGDAQGLTGVSMRKIAAALGAGTMSLYNYVPKKEHLFDLMLDAVAGEYDLPPEPSGEPRADLTLMAEEALRVMRRHPWVPALVMARPSIGPNSVRCTEFFLAAVSGAGLRPGSEMELYAIFNGSLCQFAEFERSAAVSVGSRWQSDLVTYLSGVIATGRYPHLAAAMTTGASAPPDPAEMFARLLDRLITMVLAPTN